MNRMRKMAGIMALGLGLALGCSLAALTVQAQAPDAGAGKQQYTLPEYNAQQACAADKNPASQIKCLDDFVSKYPNSALLVYVYPFYIRDYLGSNNFPKVIEYSDKLLALGDKVELNSQFEALYARATAYTRLPSPTADQAKAARDAAATGLKVIPQLKKPEGVDDKNWDDQKKTTTEFFYGTTAAASRALKDFPAAIEAYKAVLALDPDDAVSNYQLGQTYLAVAPPQQMDAFWYTARAAVSKKATEAQSKAVKGYLRKLLVNYQQPPCDNLVDAEENELLQLAGSSTTRPDSYKLASSQDLDAARKDMTIASVINDLKAGGDKAKLTWLASCGLEFPEVPGKVIEITPGTGSDPTILKLAFVTSEEEFNTKTTADLNVKVVGQPDAARVEKDSAVHFTATLVSYDPDPAFMVHWDKGKIKDDDIPKEKTPTKKPPVRRPATKKPSN